MAALETPWIDSMSPSSHLQDNGAQPALRDPNPPTVAAFSPTTISGSSLTSRQRSSVIVHRKSPLLVATPPPVTRSLAYSHPFLLPLNKLVGLLSWSSGDPWSSFLLVAAFWAIVLYSDAIILYAGPILVVVGLILGMYSRRYSPLSSTGLTGDKHGHKRQQSEASSTRHHKSLDEIVETMREFTTRCNILLGPLLEMTDFLSTQRTPTSATTRPALTALFLRILCVTPIWILLTLPPFYIITTRRVILIFGTIVLTYHSRPARVSRVVLWRSLTVRRICSFLTGLNFSSEVNHDATNDTVQSKADTHATAIAAKSKNDDPAGIRFTFIVYENQRRWLGIGWTYSLFPHERSAWTDEHLNPVPPKDSFELPDAKDGNAVWRWVEGSEWRIDGADESGDGGGWIYYDNKWQDGRRGQDGWGKYTRRRKWYRDAELVELDESAMADLEKPPAQEIAEVQDDAASITAPSVASSTRKRRWFGGSKDMKITSVSPSAITSSSNPSAESPSSAGPDTSVNATSRPVNIQNSRTTSFSNTAGSYDTYSSSPGQKSASSSQRRRRGSGGGSGDGDSQSIRNREIEESQDRLDRWGARATGGTERVERELGLGDDVNMGLS